MTLKTYTLQASSGTVEYWYDGSAGIRSWYACRFDHEGNQIGTADFSHTRREILDTVRDLLSTPAEA